MWGCNAIYLKRIISEFHAVQVTVYPMLFSIPFFFTAGWFRDDPMVGSPDMHIFISMLYQSLVTAAYGFVSLESDAPKIRSHGHAHLCFYHANLRGFFWGMSSWRTPVCGFGHVYSHDSHRYHSGALPYAWAKETNAAHRQPVSSIQKSIYLPFSSISKVLTNSPGRSR